MNFQSKSNSSTSKLQQKIFYIQPYIINTLDVNFDKYIFYILLHTRINIVNFVELSFNIEKAKEIQMIGIDAEQYYEQKIQKIFNNMKRQQCVLVMVLLLLGCFWVVECADGCLEFYNGQCLRCDSTHHLYQNRCFENMVGCLKYQNGDVCVECDSSFSVLADGVCEYGDMSAGELEEKLSKVYMYDGTQGEQYGEASFRYISVEEAQSLKTFQTLDTFVRGGEYRHRISKTQNPVFSVYTYSKPTHQSFKILYDGTGGAVILCIGDVDLFTFAPKIRSIVVISVHQRIDNCNLYTENSACERCIDGYHLEQGQCYPSIGGCVSYTRNICVACAQMFLLIENRCVADCLTVSDCRMAFYYGINTQSSIQQLYGSNISSYTYTSTTTSIVITTQTTSTSSGNGTVSTTTSTTNRTSTVDRSGNISLNPIIDDGNCVNYDFQNSRCGKCSYFYYYDEQQGKCIQVDPFCKTYSDVNGDCLSCYSGYLLDAGQCLFQ